MTVTAGGRTYLRQLAAGGSTHASHGPGCVFELGASATYDAVEIRWPGGASQPLEGGQADTTLVAEEGS